MFEPLKRRKKLVRFWECHTAGLCEELSTGARMAAHTTLLPDISLFFLFAYFTP